MKKKRKSSKKVSLPFYKNMLFWTILTVAIMIFFGVLNLMKKQNVTTYENSEIVMDSAKVTKFNVEGDYIAGNKFENKDNIYNKSQNTTITTSNNNDIKCEELKKKHQKLVDDMKNIKDETAKSIIKEELKYLEKEIELNCNQ